MKIVHVINNLATGGAETLVVNLCVELHHQGHEVKIITTGRGEGVPRARALELGVPIQELGTMNPAKAWFSLRKAVRGADAIHVHLFPTLYIAAGALFGLPKIYTEHSTTNRRRNNKLFRIFDRWAYRQFSHIVAISDGVKYTLNNYLESLNVKTPVTVIENGIATEFYSRKTPSRNKVEGALKVVAIGTLDERKNFALAIRAVEALDKISLTIYGDGPLKEELLRQIDTANLTHQVSLAGSTRDVCDALDAHDCLLSSSRYEGFSLVAAEAQARALPVIGPRVQGFDDVVKDNITGLLYDQEDGVEGLQGMVEALTTLRDDTSTYLRLSKAAAEGAASFSISMCAERHVALYRAVEVDSTRRR